MSDFEKKILEFKNRLNSTQDSKEIESIRTDIFSKNGFINSQFKKLGSLSEDEKKTFASNINKAKQELLEIFRAKATEVLDKDLDEKIKKEKIDITLPERPFVRGKIHPVSQTIDEISSIFSAISVILLRPAANVSEARNTAASDCMVFCISRRSSAVGSAPLA